MRTIWIGVGCFVAFVVVLGLLMGGPIVQSHFIPDKEVKLPLLAIVGVMALLAALAIVSVTFSLAGLSDPTQALGLPEGSVRAVIALSLIVLFAITSVFLHGSLASTGVQRTGPLTAQEAADFQGKLRGGEVVGIVPTGDSSKPSAVVYRTGSQAAEDFAKQVFTLIGTLMTAVASFYFATKAVAAGQPRPARSSPSLTGISVATGARGATVPLEITGTDLQLAQTVELVQGTTKVAASGVTSNETQVKCTFVLGANLQSGAYDVVVTNSDGGTARLSGAFTVT